MTNTRKEYRTRPILSDPEVRAMIRKADELYEKNLYFKHRAKALVGLLRKFGKRRQEIVTLRIPDLEVKEGFLFVTFTLVKKRKHGLAQYIRLMKPKKDNPTPEAIARWEEFRKKSYADVNAEWEEWKKTKEGYHLKEDKRIKKVIVKDRYAKHILAYLDYLKTHIRTEFLFPSGQAIFGQDYIVDETRHLNGRELLRIVKELDPTAWVHLFRETKGAEVSQEYPQSLSAIAHVRDTLDLEKEETAYRYVRRYSAQEMKAEP